MIMAKFREVRLQSLVKQYVPGRAKDLIKNLVWHAACRHENARPPIFLFASRRAGGTWLAELLSRQSGVLFINEPTETGKYDRVALSKGVFPPDILAQDGLPISSDDLDWTISFFKRIINGTTKIRQPWNPFAANFHFSTDRVLIKTHVTKPYLNEISKSFDESANIWLVRHPIPQAISSRRIGSQVTSDLYLRVPRILAELSAAQLKMCNKILQNGNTEECLLLDWCLENLIPVRYHHKINNLVCISYEQLVMERFVTLKYLGEYCELGGLAKEAARDSPSISTSEQSKARVITSAQQGSTSARQMLVDSWLDTVSNQTLDRCQNLLESFDIDLYSADSPLMNEKYKPISKHPNVTSDVVKEQ